MSKRWKWQHAVAAISGIMFLLLSAAPCSADNLSPVEIPREAAGSGATVKPIGIEPAVKAGNLVVSLTGDGKGTSKAQVSFFNTSNSLLKVHIPRYQAFLPDRTSFQVMVATEESFVDILPGSYAVVQLPTVCASPKTMKPPPAEGCQYTPGAHPNPEMYSKIVSILQTCNDPEMVRTFEKVPIPSNRKLQTIAQMSVWREWFLATGNPKDAITPETIKEELLTAAGAPPETLTPKQHEQIDSGVNSIFEAVDLTCKRSQDTPIAKGPPPENGGTPVASNPPTVDPPAVGEQEGKGCCTQTRPATTQRYPGPGTGTQPRPGGGSDPRDLPGEPNTKPPCPCSVQLIWRPIGFDQAGNFMHLMGDLNDGLASPGRYYHSCLVVQFPDANGECNYYVIEMTDYLSDAEAAAEVGQVANIDAYLFGEAGIRCWKNGQPNHYERCRPPIIVSNDCKIAKRIHELVTKVKFPLHDYGDDIELPNGTEDDWMCNSLTGYLLTRAGVDTADPRLRPSTGATPGWEGGRYEGVKADHGSAPADKLWQPSAPQPAPASSSPN